MMFLEKMIRADELRPSRFHTQAGEFCGWREFQNLLPSVQSWLSFRLTGHRSAYPWWTWRAIRFTEKHLRKTDRVLEAGAGYSSLWLAERCRAVQSIENSEVWGQRVRAEATRRGSSNLEIFETEDTAATFAKLVQQAVAGGEPYDVAVIDSSGDRTCMLETLKEIGPTMAPRLIVYDNTDRVDDRNAVLAFRSHCYETFQFRGFGPQLVHAWETTVFLKRRDQ